MVILFGQKQRREQFIYLWEKIDFCISFFWLYAWELVFYELIYELSMQFLGKACDKIAKIGSDLSFYLIQII